MRGEGFGSWNKSVKIWGWGCLSIVWAVTGEIWRFDCWISLFKDR